MGSDDDLLRQAYLLTGDTDRAERLTRRALAAAAQHSRRTGPAGSDEVVRNELVRALLAEAAPGGHARSPLPPGRHAAAWAALGGLPARRRAVLVLRYAEGLPDERIAERLGTTPRSVHADAEAGLLTLGPALGGDGEPGRLVAAALADAGRQWARNERQAATGADADRESHSWAPGPVDADGYDWWSSTGQAAGPTGPGRSAAPAAGPTGSPGPTDSRPGPGGRIPDRGVPAGWEAGDRPQAATWDISDRREPAAWDGGRDGGATGRAAGGGATRADHPGPAAGRTGGPDDPSFAAATFPLDQPRPRHRFRAPAMIAAAGLTAFVLAAAAVLVPPALGGDDAPVPKAGAAAESSQAAVPAVPTRSVPKGLLDWPARGPLRDDPQALTAATAAWKTKAPAAEAPASAVSLLYAGELDGRHVAVVQALDKDGTARVAQLSGYAPTAYRLVHAEPLTGRAELLSIMPPNGRGGRLRVLVSPEGQAADGLLASDVSKVPLRKVPVSADGVSDVLPSPPGVPTCSRVVLMGLPAPLGRAGPRVLESGIVIADMLGAMTMGIEVGSSTLAAGDDAVPQTVWFTDGEALAKKARLGKTKATVAALGPRVAAQPLSATDKRALESRAYELRAGGRKYVGAVVTFAGRTICTTVSRVSPGQEGRLTAFALRCPVPSGTAGLVHVVGGADVQSVQVQLDPTPDPPGQAPYGSFVQRPESGSTGGFAVLDVVGSAFPCGTGTVQATGTAESSQPIRLPVFTP